METFYDSLRAECGIRPPEPNEQDWEICAVIYQRTGDCIAFYERHADELSAIQKDQLITMIVQGVEEHLTYAGDIQATPHKARLTAWRRICLHLFRHLAQKFLAGRMFRNAELRSLLANMRQPSGVISIQSDEKSDCASAPPALCGIAYRNRCGSGGWQRTLSSATITGAQSYIGRASARRSRNAGMSRCICGSCCGYWTVQTKGDWYETHFDFAAGSGTSDRLYRCGITADENSV